MCFACRSFANEDASTLLSTGACNLGSQGVGAHCSTDPNRVFTYCSHCDRGDGANNGGYNPGANDNGHNRQGCGHDQWGYGFWGEVWVR